VLDYTYKTKADVVSDFSLQLKSTVSAIPATINSTNMYPAEILVSNDGKYVYVSNRDANPGPELRDCVSVFKFDGKGLTFVSSVQVGHYPRSMALTKEGDFLYVAGQKGGNVRAFRVNKQTGALTVNGQLLYGAHHDPAFVGVF
jgi:6-phosphogluconolactonase